MGSRFNVFFADKYDANINEARDCKKSMHAVLKAAVADCISKAVELSGDEYDGYSGDIACGEKKLIECLEVMAGKYHVLGCAGFMPWQGGMGGG